jgi:hypothetical protein
MRVQHYDAVDDLTDLLEAVRARATDPERQSDKAQWSRFRDRLAPLSLPRLKLA